jgi:hypothetical protein
MGKEESNMRSLTVVILFAAACDVGSAPDGANSNTAFVDDNTPTLSGGSFGPLGTYTDIGGEAFMARGPGGTTLYIAVSGLMPDMSYMAHLHVASCANNGGGHYKIDPSITSAVEANELWLHGQSTPVGTMFVSQDYTHVTRSDAKSIVVHDHANGAKMACADLE